MLGTKRKMNIIPKHDLFGTAFKTARGGGFGGVLLGRQSYGSPISRVWDKQKYCKNYFLHIPMDPDVVNVQTPAMEGSTAMEG